MIIFSLRGECVPSSESFRPDVASVSDVWAWVVVLI